MMALQERVHGTAPPPAWALGKLHRVLRVRKSFKNFGMKENNLLSLSYGRIIRKNIEAAEGLLPESFETYQIVEPGNIVLRLTDLQNDKRSLRQGLVRERGIITSAYDALDVSGAHDPRFWAYALLALDLAKYYYSLGGGVRQSINFADFPNDWIAIPDRDQQSAIADFLDSETARIDQLIDKKLALSDLLAARKASVVSSIVTGMSSTVKVKATGSLYLPEIPIHWSLPKLKQIAQIRGGIALGRAIPPQITTIEVPYLRVANVQAGNIDLSDVASLRMTAEEAKRYRLNKGDVLMNEGGDNDKLGRGAVWQSEIADCTHQNHVFAVRPFDLRFSDWISLATGAKYARDFFFLNSKQSTNLASISKSRLAQFPVPLPPVDEVFALTQEAKRRIGQIGTVIKAIRLSINQLHALRSALITEAVTGQLNIAAEMKNARIEHSIQAIEAGAQR
jgi:type I restriction enzyme, S subunit